MHSCLKTPSLEEEEVEIEVDSNVEQVNVSLKQQI